MSDEAFRQALTTSLDAAGLNAEAGACHYPIEVNLLGLSQPIIGFDMTVTSHASYTVFNTGGQPVLTAMIDAAYTATMSDSPWGTLRNQMATEGSIRVSIQDFFDRLRVADIK